MTMPVQSSWAGPYETDGVQTVFPFSFRVDSAAELEVVQGDGSGDSLTLPPSAYTVTGIGVEAGGNVTTKTTLSAGLRVVIRRIRPESQPTDYRTGDPFLADTFEGTDDDFIQLIQQHSERFSRTPMLPLTTLNASRNLRFPIPQANRLIGYDQAGAGMTTYPIGQLVTSAVFDSLSNYNNSLNQAVTAIAGGQQSLWITAPTTLTDHLTIPDNIELCVLRQGLIDLNGFTLTVNGPIQAGAFGIFSENGTVVLSSKVQINPVWFCSGGSGASSDPWTSTDGSAGWIRAMGALQIEGTLRASPGHYSYTTTTPADITILPNTTDTRISLFLHGVRIIVTVNTTVLRFNPNVDVGIPSNDMHTILIEGGFFDSGSDSSPVRGTAINVDGCRNVTIRNVRFRGMSTGIKAGFSDTARIHDCYFRRFNVGIDLTNIWTGRIIQDVWIYHCSGSVNLSTGSVFILGTAIANVHIFRNGMSNNGDHADNRLVKFATGDAFSESLDIFISYNATEQQEGGKIIEIETFGSEACKNVSIIGNEFGTALTNGEQIVHLGCVTGSVVIANNSFTTATVTAIQIDILRDSITQAQDGLCQIYGNLFAQRAAAGGKILTVGTISSSSLVFGYNSMENFYSGDRPSLTPGVDFPNNGTVLFLSKPRTSPSAAVNSASTIAIAPENDYVPIAGTTTINTITPTWHGHVVTLEFAAAPCRVADGVGNIVLAKNGDFVSRTPGESSLVLRCISGTSWREVSRFDHQPSETIASAATISPEASTEVVSLTGTTTITAITATYTGHRLTLHVPNTLQLTDGGNLHMAGNFTGSAGGEDTISFVCSGADWFETSRSTN